MIANLQPSVGLISEELRQQFWQEGFLVIKGVLANFEVEELLKACDELEAMAEGKGEDFFVNECLFKLHRDCDPFAKNADSLPPIAGMLRRVTYPYLVSNIVNMYRTHPKILQAVSEVLGDSLVQITNQINFNHPGRGTGWGWHQDYRFRKGGIDELAESFVQTLVAIDNCSPLNGGLRLIPRSQKLGALKLDEDSETAESFFDSTTALCPRLEPGDMLIFQPYVIHGSTANESRYPRRVFINGYARADRAAHGIKVMENGLCEPQAAGIMEYEGDRVVLPKAAKY